MAEKSDGGGGNSWNFYFGRGAQSNSQRKISKVNNLLNELAPRYSTCRQTEKRIFVKNEVYDVIKKNGGKFYQTIDKKPVLTEDEDDSISKIMQCLRDITKTTRPSPRCRQPRKKEKPATCPKIGRAASHKRTSSIIPARRSKRICVKQSTTKAPIVGCVSDALNCTNKSEGSVSLGSSKVKVNEKKSSNGNGITRKKSCNSESNDYLEILAAEPPKLENSFSALIMADEITADLPTDSQININQSLHARVQRLENLVAMLMQQKNEELERLF